MSKLNEILRRLFTLDGWIFLGMVLLTIFGAAAIYSVDLSHSDSLPNFKKQVVAICIGLFLFLFFALTDYTFFRATAIWWYLAGVIILIFVLFFGVTISGTTGWFRFGSLSFQPAELAKLGVILMLGFYLSKRSRFYRNSATFVGSFLIALIPAGLIFLQPDFGSALILMGGWFLTMFILGTKKRYWIFFISIVIAASVFSWAFIFKDYQKERVLTFIYPERDALGAGYNVTQSLIAVGSGKFFGRGLGFGSQSQLKFLPVAQSDFIYAVIAEELGFVGAMFVLILYGLIFVRIIYIMRSSPDDFSSITLLAAVSFLFCQFIINIGAVLGLLPVTGVPLPFVSAGGSSYIISCAILGLVESIYRDKRSVMHQKLDTF